MTAAAQDVIVRRELRPGDAEAIADLHHRVYGAEYGLDERFRASIARGIDGAARGGWPERGGAVWLVDGDGGPLRGSLGLTVEDSEVGRVRWFVLAPDLRGRGLGRSLVGELLDEARSAGMRRIVLDTFSALTTAAHIYRGVGFRLVWERKSDMWGPEITYQGYELELD